MEKIKDIVKKLDLQVREFGSYSFGDKHICKDMFVKTFTGVDKTVKIFEWMLEYDQIIEWMTDTKGKGLALFGSIGRGKTIVNSLIIPVIFYEKYKKVLRPLEADKITREDIEKWALIIDDIGIESMVNDFGTKTDMVNYAINKAEHYSKLLFLTSNLTKDELIQRYGSRIIDRIQRLCKIVIFTGKSLRQ